MVDTNFEAILKVLKDIHKDFPDLRFGEVVQNAVDESRRLYNLNLTGKSSKEILRSLNEFSLKHKKKRGKKHGS